MTDPRCATLVALANSLDRGAKLTPELVEALKCLTCAVARATRKAGVTPKKPKKRT